MAFGPVLDADKQLQRIIEDLHRGRKSFESVLHPPRALCYISRNDPTDNKTEYIIKVLVSQDGKTNCTHLRVDSYDDYDRLVRESKDKAVMDAINPDQVKKMAFGPVLDADKHLQRIVEDLHRGRKSFTSVLYPPRALCYISRNDPTDNKTEYIIKVLVSQDGKTNCTHLRVDSYDDYDRLVRESKDKTVMDAINPDQV